MRYNESNGKEINGKIVITTEIDGNPIFETSCIIVGNITANVIKANYDLVVIGNVESDKIEVAGSFSCMGNCNCEAVSVQGTCSIIGNFTVYKGFVGDSLIVKDLCAENLEVKGTVSCQNMECNKEVICHGYVLIAEGLTGTGSLSSKMTVCGEYSLLYDTSGVFIADTLEMEKPTIACPKEESLEIDIDEWKMKAKKHSTRAFYGELARLAEQQEEYKRECNAFHKLMLVENVNKVPSIKAYVDIIDILNRSYKIITNTELFQNVKACFEGFSYSDINHSKMSKITRRDFVKMLHIVTFKPQLFRDDVRELIIETLCTYVGMDLDVFQEETKEMPIEVITI